VQRTHEHGLKVIIDFIPNHVARGYRSDAKPADVKDLGEDDDVRVGFHPNNNFYYLPGESFTPPANHRPPGGVPHISGDRKFSETPAKATGNDLFIAAPDIHSWFETVKLNYGVDIRQNRTTHFQPIPSTWLKMRHILLFWANKEIDGFRCDMAEMVPTEFWNWVIPQVKSRYPDLIFIAEIYNPSQYRSFIEQGRFDYLYDKVMLYDTLRMLMRGKRTTAEIHKIQEEMEGIDRHMLHFMENHDEQRIASRFFAGNAWLGLPAMVIAATIDRGPIMIYFGQEVGEPAEGVEGFNGDDGRTTIFDYWGVPEHQKWMNGGKFDGGLLSDEQRRLRLIYAGLLMFASQSKAVSSGSYADITAHNIDAGLLTDRVHAFVRYHESERLLIINSFNDEELNVRVRIPQHVSAEMELDPNTGYIAREMLWRQMEIALDHQYTFELKLKPFSSFIFRIKQRSA
jgi:glycosidase